jgi:Zn-finger nucleic acid-binding protein
MVCPVCKESMIALELHEIEIDYCSSCEGIWLDDGELEALMEDSEEKEKLLDTFTLVKNPGERSHRCPVCRKRMQKVNVGDDEKLMIDQCKRGHGFWFDRGELHQVIASGSRNSDDRILKLLKEMFNYKLNN